MDLFDASDFLTRSQCGDWDPRLVNLYIFSNVLIGLAYILIPIQLLFIWHKKHNSFKYPFIIVFFAMFILFCGFTHICDIAVFWWAPYRFYTLILFLTGTISMITALILPIKIRYLMTLVTPKVYQDINEKLTKSLKEQEIALQALNSTNNFLKKQIQKLEKEKKRDVWVHEQESILNEMKSLLMSSEKLNGT